MIDPQTLMLALLVCMLLMAMIMLANVAAMKQVAKAVDALKKSFEDFRGKVLEEYVHLEHFETEITALRAEIGEAIALWKK